MNQTPTGRRGGRKYGDKLSEVPVVSRKPACVMVVSIACSSLIAFIASWGKHGNKERGRAGELSA